MKRYFEILIIAAFFVNASCKVSRKALTAKDDGKIEAVFVQVNDVYEIAPVAGGKEGGMARVATVKKQFKQQNPNTFLIMAGDFVSPSVYNSLKYQQKRVGGAQMIDAMNAAGMDFAVFGNHEFDISESELQDRINESSFSWISSNTFHNTSNGITFFKKTSSADTASFPLNYILNIKDNDGTTAKIGIIGLTLAKNRAKYVSYKDPLITAKAVYAQLKDSVDAVVAITHQTIADDVKLATEVPGLAAILGGHEHSGVFNKTGNVYITKAQSNARSAYIVKLSIDKEKHKVEVTPTIDTLDEKVALDSATDSVVQKWKKIADDNYATLGFDPKKIVLKSGETLEGREGETRNGSTNFTRLITESMAFACPKADVVIFNSGSIRLDDVLMPPVSQYDIIRSLPFGGGIREADMKGSLLVQILEMGFKNKNSGGFLHYQPVVYNSASKMFLINNAPIDPLKTYRVAVTEYLMSGNESNLEFLNSQNPAITNLYPAATTANDPKSDIRLALIKYLENRHVN